MTYRERLRPLLLIIDKKYRPGIGFFRKVWYNIHILLLKEGLDMDIKEKIGEIADKVKGDKDLQKNITKDPVKAVEGVTGIDLPDEKINKVVDAAKDKVGDVIDKIKK